MTTTAPQPTKAETLPTGRVVAIAGPVIDVEFPPTPCPRSTAPSRSTWCSRGTRD